MNGPTRAVPKPRDDVTAEQARTARARAWSYIFSCYEKHKAVEAQDGDVEADFSAERHARESGRANHRSGGGDF